MALELRLQVTLQRRQVLEDILEQKLSHQIRHEITLSQYLQLEDLMKSLIQWAGENDSWTRFNRDGFDFNYIEVPYELAAPIADTAGLGFSHCQYDPMEAIIFGRKVAIAKGDWTLFVVKDQVPDGLEDYVAMHERGEELSLGNHYFASQMEFALARKDRITTKYNEFIDREFPSKFVDLTEEVLFPVIPEELLDYIRNDKPRNSEELAWAEQLINQYPIPSATLELMARYDRITESIYSKIRDLTGPIQKKVFEQMEKIGNVEDAAKVIDSSLSSALREIDPRAARVIVKRKIDEAWENMRNIIRTGIFDHYGSHIEIIEDFTLAYIEAKQGKRIAEVRYSIRDNARKK